MKTITYNPETHKLVPLDMTNEMGFAGQQERKRPFSSLATVYRAMLNAAPAAEEAPGQEPGRNHWEDGDVFERIAAIKQQPKQQPASNGVPNTHGGPVFKCTGCGHIYMNKVTQCDCMPDVQEFDEGTVVFGSPQPTPELVQAARQALEALNSQYIVNCGAWRIQQDQAITSLQNALKGST